MKTKKEKILKLFGGSGLVLIFSAVISAASFALMLIYDVMPYKNPQTDDPYYYLDWISDFRSAFVAANDKPGIWLFAFVFAALIWAVFTPILRKMKYSAAISVFSFVISAAFCLWIAFGEGLLIVLFIIFFAVGSLPFMLAEIISRKKISFKKFSYASGAVLSAAVIAVSFFASSIVFKPNFGEPDKTNSWQAINQEIDRSDNWKQVVKDSPFQLEFIREIKNGMEKTASYSLGTYPNIDGSTVCVPMAAEFARQHLGLNDSECIALTDFSTTHYAYESLINRDNGYYNSSFDEEKNVCFSIEDYKKPCELLLGTEPSEEELEMAKEAGVTLVKKPICYDAFVFITHKDNPVESLTVEQIKDIYTGKIKNWKQVGGKDEKIRAFQREENSGSQTAMENLVMGGKNMIDPITVSVITGMGGLVDAVAEYDNDTASLGYTYRYYIDTLYKNDNIKTIAVDGISPTDENIRSGKYPFSTNYYGVIRAGEENETGGKFLDWILSDEGQKCVEQAGYIAMQSGE